MKPSTRLALWAAALLSLAGVSLAYLNPHLIVDLATRVWSCW